METKEIVGYVLMGVGVIVAALSYAPIRTMIKIPFPAGINELYVMIAGAIVLIVGAFITFKGRGAVQHHEVPIYEGHGKERKVVAYQRMHKK